jgi:hypothetical protein
MKFKLFITILLILNFVCSCEAQIASNPKPLRVKITPASDEYPPILHSNEFKQPIPINISTIGVEDSPFISGNNLFLAFTPDPSIPPRKQLFDGLSGIWVSKRQGRQWGKPERVLLQEPGKLSLDGCAFVQGDRMWFCSTREGYKGMNWFTAEYVDGKWQNWRDANFGIEVEEIHIFKDELYFGSKKKGGKGKKDIWYSKKVGGRWQAPQNIAAVNSKEDEARPFVRKDELWFDRTYKGTPAVFRSKRINGKWQKPEMIVSQFAGEPNLDENGNLYFVHPFFKSGKMIEADIYVAYRKKSR